MRVVLPTQSLWLPRTYARSLRQRQEQLLHLGIVWGSESSGGVPAFDGGKSVGATPRVGPVLDVVENMRMLIQNWVDETDWTLANRKTLLVDLGM